MKEQKEKWDILSAIDCSTFTEKKNGLTYLSWAWAWACVKKNYPSANYEVTMFDNKPYLFDENLGYMVQTTVSIEGEKISMQLPVMDGANKAQKHIKYTYEVKEYQGGKWTGNYVEKNVEAATMFDINTAIMRGLVKNLAMFGLGHYIYAGEDLPKVIETESEMTERKNAEKVDNDKVNALRDTVEGTQTIEELKSIWEANKELHGVLSFKVLVNDKRLKLEKEQSKKV